MSFWRAQLSQLQVKYAQDLLQEREAKSHIQAPRPTFLCDFIPLSRHSDPYCFIYWLNDEANYCQHTLNKKPKNLLNM